MSTPSRGLQRRCGLCWITSEYRGPTSSVSPWAAPSLWKWRRAAWLLALSLFPEPWQRALRMHAAAVVGAVPAGSYLGMGLALARWAMIDRLGRLRSRVLLIAAEHDFTPLAEKRELAARLKADIVVVRGSRHGTPFDSVEATNASLLALLTDQPLPPQTRWVRDTPARAQALSLRGGIAEDHASGA